MDKTKVIIQNTQKAVKIPTGIRILLRRSCTAVLAMERFVGSAEVNITFVDNEQIRTLNSQHRNIDKETDVLSFPLGENGEYESNPENGNKMLGDVVISVEKAISQAEQFNHSLQREISYLTVHSVLHLLGYDHVGNEANREIMREKEEQVMAMIGLTR